MICRICHGFAQEDRRFVVENAEHAIERHNIIWFVCTQHLALLTQRGVDFQYTKEISNEHHVPLRTPIPS